MTQKADRRRVASPSRIARSEAIVFTELDDTVVMMDVDEGRYYELDPIGARLWYLTESGPTVAGVCEALVAEYEVAPKTCREEVETFLEELSRLGVVRIRQWNAQENGGTPGGTGQPSGASADTPPGGGRRRTPGRKLVWTTPAIRVMDALKRTASGPTQSNPLFESPDYTPPES